MWKLLSSAVSPGGRRGTLSVLFFHRVLPQADPVLGDEPTAAGFERMLGWLQSQFNLLSLDGAVERLRAGTLPPAAAAITFDDGYRDNHTVAAPLLQRLGVPATFFVSTAFLDGGTMWNDRVTEAVRLSPLARLQLPELGLADLALGAPAERGHAASRVLGALKYLPGGQRDTAVQRVTAACGAVLPTDLMMTGAQVRDLADRGFCIGAHTHTHPILTQLPAADAAAEISRGKQVLEALLGRRVGLFAYPNGRAGQDFDNAHRDMARAAGFDAAFTTEAGVCHSGSDPWTLPRFTPWDRTEWRFRLRLLANQRRRAAAPAAAESPGLAA